MIISVIVPLYKGNSYLDNILHMMEQNAVSLKNDAPDAHIELILVNDSPSIPVKLPASDRGYNFSVNIINNPRNQGIHQSRVNGLQYAAGEWILMLDQDDWITPDCILSQLRLTDGADMVIGNGYRMEDNKQRIIYRNLKKQHMSGREYIYLYAANQIVSPGQCLIRKSSIPKAWYDFIITENGGDDLFLWLLMMESHCKFAFNFSCVYTHVDTGENLSLNLPHMYRSAENVIMMMHKCGIIKEKNIKTYQRRISFLKILHSGSFVKKILICLRNPDICLCKLYAYYR